MGNFGRGNGGDGRSFSGRKFGGGFSGDRGGDRPMFKAVCSNCGDQCEVPFRPTNGKPVYCSNCFEKMGNGGHTTPPRSDRPRFEVSSGDQKNSQLEEISTKLDRIIKLLEPKMVEVFSTVPVVEKIMKEKMVSPKVKKTSSIKKIK